MERPVLTPFQAELLRAETDVRMWAAADAIAAAGNGVTKLETGVVEGHGNSAEGVDDSLVGGGGVKMEDAAGSAEAGEKTQGAAESLSNVKACCFQD